MISRWLSIVPWALAVALGGATPAVCGAASDGAGGENFRFFRSDAGVALAEAGSLPGDLEQPNALRWRVPVDPGHSSPVQSRGRIFLTTFREEGRELATVAYEARTGRELWRRPVPSSRIEEFHRQSGGPAQATPACDGERVFAFFGSHGLVALDFEGRQLWEHRMGPFQDEYGAGSSPILIDDKVIVQQDHDVGSFIMALERRTGRMVWRVERPEAVRSYSSPAVWIMGGRTQLLVAGALQLAGYDPRDGRKLWWFDGLARIVIPVPVPMGETIYMASWAPGADAGRRLALDDWPQAVSKWDRDHSGRLSRAEVDNPEVLDRFFRMDLNQDGELDAGEWSRHAAVFRRAKNALLAVRPTGEGALGPDAVVWEHLRGVPYVASPLVDREVVWMVKDGGIVTKLDAASGTLLQEERLPGLGSYYASPAAGDGKVYFASEAGVVTVVANSRDWRVISSRDFKERIQATPLIDSDRIYIRTAQALYCFGVR